MNHDFEYINMHKMIERARKGLAVINEEVSANPGIIGDKDPELQDKTLDTNNTDEKITLDFAPKEATIIGEMGAEVSDRVKTGLQKILNSYLATLQGSEIRAERVSIKIGDETLQITVSVLMGDQQPATIFYETLSGKVQLKYDNFLELSKENMDMMTKTYNYFTNPDLREDLSISPSLA